MKYHCAICFKLEKEIKDFSGFINCSCHSPFSLYLGHKVCQNCYCEKCEACFATCKCIRCYSCRQPQARKKQICNLCDNCNDCCKCWVCTGCRSKVSYDPKCDLCFKCETCCKCLKCKQCEVFSKTGHLAICSDCRNCTECCCCENSFFPSGVRVLHRPSLNFHPSNPKDKISRYIGVEIEVSESNPDDGEHIFETLTKWGCAAVHDGSLPETGYEINTAPAKGEVFEKEINAVCAALKVANAKVNSSCGLHVHIDCRDLNFYDLKKTILVYSKVEESLFRMLAKSRTTNHYCQKINKKFDKILIEKDKNWRKNLLEQTYGSNSLGIREARRDKYNEARYYALNIHSWFYRKTLEFRQHQGTVDPKKIINWAKICQSIVNFAVKHSEREIEKHFQNVPIELRLPTILTEDLKDYYFSRVNLFHRPKKIEDTPELVMADTNNTIVVQNESVWTVPNENYTLTLNTATNSNDDLF